MSSLFDSLINAKLDGTRFSFYTDKEIEAISVKEITDPMAYDQLGNPNPGGLCDEALGVSAMDKFTICKTCGCDSVHCPGHLGHIKLISTCYNPFTIKLLQKLLRAKCQMCHKIRIYPNKIELLEIRLRLIKLGYIVEAAKLGEYTDFKLESAEASLRMLRKRLTAKSKAKDGEGDQEMDNEKKDEILTALEKLTEKEKEEREIFFTQISSILEQNEPQSSTNITVTIAVRKILREIMGSVVPSRCPHCEARNPRIRKEGATKFFQMPLSQKDLKSMKGAQFGKIDMRVDISTIGALSEFEDEDSESLEEEEQKTQNQEQTPERKQKYMNPLEVREHMKRLWAEEKDLLEPVFGNWTIFFLNNVLVSPNRFRPESSGGASAGGDREFLHAHSAMLTRILKANQALRKAVEMKEHLGQEEEKDKETASERTRGMSTDLGRKEYTSKDVIRHWIDLQDAINCYLDSSLATKTENRERPGLRQLLERKEGVFRMKMMGKRVNYAGRSVISPDPYISTDNIGVPEFIARTLTFPESVRNLEKLQRYVINGAHKYPGANFIEYPNGEKKALEHMTFEERKAEAALLGSGGKTVYRHLETGDPLLVNRQPTLHKPSIMAHIARVLPKEQTIRMHYSNCKSYNADFDGDEMNIHLPQNYTAIAEAYEIAATHKQYIVPTSGEPIRGLIQDFIVSSVFLTCKDTFLNKEQYNQLIYASLNEFIDNGTIPRVHLEIPAILKSRQGPLWTGKQVISTILKNLSFNDRDFKDENNQKAVKAGLNLTSTSKLNPSNWGKIGPEEGKIIIRNNELLQGVLDKNQLGDSKFGMIHSFYEVYGSKRAGQLLTALGRLLTTHLQYHGFTCGIDDGLLNKEFNQKRDKILEHAHKRGIQAGAEFCGIKIDYASGKTDGREGAKNSNDSSDEENADHIDEREEKRIMQEIKLHIEKRFVNEGLHIEKEFDAVVQSEMNEATTNVIDKCIPDGLIKNFPRNNMSAMVLTGAKGGKINRSQIACLLGQQALEGKRVPRMPNGKTLPSFPAFDPNPRSSGYINDRFITGLRPQDFYFHCMAGREGLIDTAVKTARSGYLQRCLIKQLESLVVSYDMTVRDNDGSVVQFLYGEDSIDVTEMLYLNKFDFLQENYGALFQKYYSENLLTSVDTESVSKARKKDREQQGDVDPILSRYNPARFLGSTSEKMHHDLKKFIKGYKKEIEQESIVPSAQKKIKPKTFEKLYYFKYLKSLVHPGENVGTLAAQSIGEPSTQMTLNTFHLAGHGGANVTLGIPRLREILMTASENLKTPLMILPLRKDKEFTDAEINSFANKFQKLQLSEVINNVKVNRDYILKGKSTIISKYDLTFEFENLDKIEETFSVTSADLNKVFTNQFLPLLMKNINKQSKKGIEDQMAVKDTKTKHMQEKEQNEDEELLEEYREEDPTPKRKSSDNDMSDIDDINDLEGTDGENLKKNVVQVEGYEDDQNEEQQSEVSEARSGHVFADENMEIEDFDDNASQKTKISNIELGNKLSNFKPYLQKLQFVQQENKPKFSRAKIVMEIHLNLDTHKSKMNKILMLSLVEAILQKVLIRSVKGINRSYVIERKSNGRKEKVIQTEGINFEECFNNDEIFDLNRLETNDINQMMKHYGIEAARNCIVNEIRNVFGVYGIEVDYRHLSLVADFMTQNGTYKPFNRIGMQDSNSPFLKASFETSTSFLSDSCIKQDHDDNTTPSSAIVLGQIPKIGTGVFDLLHDHQLE